MFFSSIINDIRVYQHILVFENLTKEPLGVIFANSSWDELASSWDKTDYIRAGGHVTALHDVYLVPIVNYGFLGLSVMAMIIGRLFVEYWKVVKQGGGESKHLIGLANGWLSLMLYSFFHSDGIINGFPISMVVTCLLIGASAASRRAKWGTESDYK